MTSLPLAPKDLAGLHCVRPHGAVCALYGDQLIAAQGKDHTERTGVQHLHSYSHGWGARDLDEHRVKRQVEVRMEHSATKEARIGEHGAYEDGEGSDGVVGRGEDFFPRRVNYHNGGYRRIEPHGRVCPLTCCDESTSSHAATRVDGRCHECLD